MNRVFFCCSLFIGLFIPFLLLAAPELVISTPSQKTIYKPGEQILFEISLLENKVSISNARIGLDDPTIAICTESLPTNINGKTRYVAKTNLPGIYCFAFYYFTANLFSTYTIAVTGEAADPEYKSIPGQYPTVELGYNANVTDRTLSDRAAATTVQTLRAVTVENPVMVGATTLCAIGLASSLTGVGAIYGAPLAAFSCPATLGLLSANTLIEVTKKTIDNFVDNKAEKEKLKPFLVAAEVENAVFSLDAQIIDKVGKGSKATYAYKWETPQGYSAGVKRLTKIGDDIMSTADDFSLLYSKVTYLNDSEHPDEINGFVISCTVQDKADIDGNGFVTRVKNFTVGYTCRRRQTAFTSPKYLAIASKAEDNYFHIKIINVQSNSEVSSFSTEDLVWDEIKLEFIPNTNNLLVCQAARGSGAWSHSAELYNYKSGKKMIVLDMGGSSYSDPSARDFTNFAVSPQGTYIGATDGQRIRLWNALTGKKIRDCLVGNNKMGIDALVWTVDEKYICLTGRSGEEWTISNLIFLEMTSCKIVFNQKYPPENRAFITDGSSYHFIENFSGRVLNIGQLTYNKIEDFNEFYDQDNYFPISNDIMVATGKNSKIKIFDIANRKICDEFEVNNKVGSQLHLVAAPAANYFLFSDKGGWNLYDMTSKRITFSFSGSNPVISASGDFIAAKNSNGGTIDVIPVILPGTSNSHGGGMIRKGDVQHYPPGGSMTAIAIGGE